MPAAEWYKDKFDAKLIRTPQPDNQPDRVDIDMDGLMIFVAGKLPDGREIEEPRDPHYGLDHFGLRVRRPGRHTGADDFQRRGDNRRTTHGAQRSQNRLCERPRQRPHRTAPTLLTEPYDGMRFGIFVFDSARNMDPATLAKRLKSWDSVPSWIPEHTVLPVYPSKGPSGSTTAEFQSPSTTSPTP